MSTYSFHRFFTACTCYSRPSHEMVSAMVLFGPLAAYNQDLCHRFSRIKTQIEDLQDSNPKGYIC